MQGHLQFLDENIVVYPCGHHIVIYNTETKEQNFIHGTIPEIKNSIEIPSSEGISALAVTSNRRLIGVAESGVLSIFDAQSRRRRRILHSPEVGTNEIISISFSADSKLALVLSGAPDWNLVLWTTDRTAKVLAVTKFASHAQNQVAGAGTVL